MLIESKTPLSAHKETWTVSKEDNIVLQYYVMEETGEHRYPVTGASEALGKDASWLSKNLNAAQRQSMRDRWAAVGNELYQKGKIEAPFSGTTIDLETDAHGARLRTLSELDFFVIIVSEYRRNNPAAIKLMKHLRWE